MIDNNIEQKQRLEKLNQTARKELEILINDKNILGVQELDTKTNMVIKNK